MHEMMTTKYFFYLYRIVRQVTLEISTTLGSVATVFLPSNLVLLAMSRRETLARLALVPERRRTEGRLFLETIQNYILSNFLFHRFGTSCRVDADGQITCECMPGL